MERGAEVIYVKNKGSNKLRERRPARNLRGRESLERVKAL